MISNLRYGPVILLLICCTAQLPGYGQVNLVPNPSFEERNECPFWYWEIEKCNHWFNVSGSNDYFHLCSINGSLLAHMVPGLGEPPRTDSAMARSIIFGGNYREYLGINLVTPLESGRTYCIQLWISLADGAGHYIDRFEAILTPNIPVVNDPVHPAVILASPTIILATHHLNNDDGWERIGSTYCASGGEEYLTFGIFSPADSINTYTHHPLSGSAPLYFIDDVALYPCDAPVDSANAGPDVFFCTGDSVQLGTHQLPEYRYYWYMDTVLVSQEARPVFAPTQTTTYTLLVKDFKFDESRDTVTAHWVNCDTIPLGCDQKEILVCLGDSVQLGCHHKSNYTYAWQQLPDTTIISTQGFLTAGDQAASYVLHMTDYTRRSQSDTIEVIPVDCAPIGQGSGGSYEICPGDTLLLGQESLPGASYAWYAPALLPDSTSLIRVSPQASTTYQLVVENPRKDQFVFHYRVTIGECDIPLFVPNAFTPDGDGLNDVFEIGMPPGTHLEMLIFNRWGNHLFTANQHRFWDGTYNGVDVPSGVYYYSLTATLPPYRTTRLQGTVMVLRGQ